MRIVHLLHEFPDPPNSGVRCDMGRRLDAFLKLGHAVFVVAWNAGGAPRSADVDALAARVDRLELLPIGHDAASRLRRIANLARHPSYIAARIPPRAVREALIERIRGFAPDLIWLEGVHPSWLALELKRRLGVPLAYRSHNIEHRYVPEQARLSTSRRQRLALWAGAWGLEAAERRTIAAADRMFDISADDLAWWQAQGVANAEWLAMQPDPAVLATSTVADGARDIDLLFVGSLSSPNAIAGLDWYIEDVAPLLRRTAPDLRVVVAGREPPARLVERLEAAGVGVIADPPLVAPLFARARATMNPILHGSGINVKTVDMLAAGRPVVTTAKGARGLPDEVVAELAVADEPAAFAEAIRAAVADHGGADRAALIERVFGRAAVACALAHVGGPAVE